MLGRAKYAIGVVREAFRRFDDDDHAVYAGHMAFTLLLSFGPFVVCAILLARFFDPDASAHLIGLIALLKDSAILPNAIADLLINVVDTVAPQAEAMAENAVAGDLTVVIISAAIGLYAGSSAFEAARKGFNEAYDVRDARNVVFRRVQSHLLAFSLAALFAFASLAFVTVTISFNALDEIRQLMASFGFAGPAWGLVLLLIAGGLVALMFYVLLLGIHVTLPRGYVRRWRLYVWAQDEIEDVRAVEVPILPGVRWTAILWILFAIGFSQLLGSIVSFDSNHGALAGVVATLLFFYISAAMIFFGAQINIAIATVGPDGKPAWPHPHVERTEAVDETRQAAYQVLTVARPVNPLKRLWFLLWGGAIAHPHGCLRPKPERGRAAGAAGSGAGTGAAGAAQAETPAE